MNILVINGHPDHLSFGQAIYERYLENIDKQKHSVRCIELNKMEFEPVLRFGYRERMEEDPVILKSQEDLIWADHLVFVYPIWWSSMPSLLKGWIDRVFTPGIAYSSNSQGLFLLNFLRGRQFTKRLKGKTADILTTSMAPSWWYPLFSGNLSIADSYGIAILKSAVLKHCGVKTKKVLNLGNMGRAVNTEKIRYNFLQKVKKRAQSI